MKKSKLSWRIIAIMVCITLCMGSFIGFFGNRMSVNAAPGSESEATQYVSLYHKIDQSKIGGDAGASKSQYAEKLFDKDSATSWCVKKGTSEPSGYEKSVWWSMTEAVTVDAYTLMTGPGGTNIIRDPWAWTLYGTNDEATFNGSNTAWTQVDAVTEGNLPEERSAISNTFVVDNPGQYKYYKLTITGNRSGETGNSAMMFAEINLFENYIDLSSEVIQDSVGGATGQSSSGAQEPDKVFDKDISTKWCTAISETDKTKSIWWAMEEEVSVKAYTLVTANDSDGRDPKTWKLYGRNNTKDQWTEISNVTDGKLPTDRSAVSDGFFVNQAVPYKYYKLTVTDNRAGLDKPYYQIAEVNLLTKEGDNSQNEQYSNLYENIDQNSVTGDTVTVFDNNFDTKWQAVVDVENADCIRAIQWAMTEAVEVDAYSMVTADDNIKGDPAEWTLYGKNDVNGEWNELSSVSEGNLPEERKTVSDVFVIENPKLYQYYKLDIANNRSDLGSAIYQLAELNLLSDGNADDSGDSGDSGNGGDSGDSGDSTPVQYVNVYDKINQSSIQGDAGASKSQYAENLFDKDSTTIWCVKKGTSEPTGYEKSVWWAMTEAVTIDAYTLLTGPEGSGNITRDPWTWKLYGTNDEGVFNGTNVAWNEVDVVTEGNLPEERSAVSDMFVVDNPGEYKYYKLTITGNRDYNPDGNSAMMFAELNLFTATTDASGGNTGDNSGSGGNTGGSTGDNNGSSENAGGSSSGNASVDTSKLVNVTNGVNASDVKGDDGVSAKQGPKAAFDGNLETKWCVETSKTDSARTLQWGMSSAVTLKAYSFTTAKDASKRDPWSWKLYGSNTPNGEWVELSSVTESKLPTARKTVSQGFGIDNPGKYQYYKLVVTDNRSHLEEEKYLHYQIGEVNLFAEQTVAEGTGSFIEDTAQTPSSVPNVDTSKLVNINHAIDKSTVTGPEGMSTKQGPFAIFDGKTITKWCVAITKEDATRTVQWSMTTPVTLKAYSLVTANDGMSRDPWAWTLSGSNDLEGEWTVLSNVTLSGLPEERETVSQGYGIDNPGEYKYYRFSITNNRSNLKQLLYQFAELNLFADTDVAGENSSAEQNSSMSWKDYVEQNRKEEPVEEKGFFASAGWWILLAVVVVAGITTGVVLLVKHKRANKIQNKITD